MQMATPEGFQSVEHDDGKVHAIDLSDMVQGVLKFRNTPVCGAATGPSSDEAGRESWSEVLDITCSDCIGIIA